MKNIKHKKNERLLFLTTLILLMMVGIAINPSINKGLFYNEKIKPTIVEEYSPPEILSPEKTIDPWPFLVGLIIIALVILRKEKIITPNKTMKFIYKIGFLTKKSIFKIRVMINKLEKLPKLELSLLKKEMLKLKRYENNEKNHLEKFEKNVKSEFLKAKYLFVKPYRHEFSHYFIVLLFVIAVVAMSIFSIVNIPYQKAAEITQTVSVNVINKSLEQFSAKISINPLTFILAVAIMIVISRLKMKKDKLIR